MKRTVFLLSAFAFLLISNDVSFAQNASVTASTDIVQDLTVANKSNLSFGQISNSQSNDATIDPNGSNSNVGNSTTLGKVQITASDGASIDISFTNPPNLTDSNSNTIGFTGNYSGNESDNAGTSTDLDEGTTNSITLGASNNIYYVYLGGTLAGGDINGAATGTYDNTITVNVSYQ